jgi:hypothetical protein
MITYEDKVALNENADILDINKVTADDMNEIKNVVNSIVENNIFKNLLNVGNAKITANTGLNFNKTNNQILINGSSTESTNILLDSPNANKDEDGIILKAGTYTATIKKESGLLANDPITFYLRKSDGTNIYDGTIVFTQIIEAGVSDGTVYSSTFTLEEETRLHWIGYFSSDLRTFNNLVLQFQIEESPTPTSYMPWAGYIVESGSNDNGRWIKYSDGSMICYGSKDVTLDCSQAWGNLFIGRYEGYISFPQEFIDIPLLQIHTRSTTNVSSWLISYDKTTVSKSNFYEVDIARATSNNSVPIVIIFIAIGKWK